MSVQEQQVVELLKAMGTGDEEPLAVIDPDKYIEHNLGTADGLAGFRTLLATLPQGPWRVNTVRVFEDGDLVAAHSTYNFFGPKIGFDIYRFENGKIVEHWDNLQPVEGPNLSGHTMMDGPTEPQELDKTEPNKKLVRAFVDEILLKWKMEKLTGFFDGNNYIQHNPQSADGLSGLGRSLRAMADAGMAKKYDKIHMVVGKGNFVLTASQGSLGGRPMAFYDLFRVENSKLAEHWDTVQAIPPMSEWKNQNGKF